jgi:hypothetical protein
MWHMPDYPVAIDGRNDLNGDELGRIFFNSQNADTSYATDIRISMKRARSLLSRRKLGNRCAPQAPTISSPIGRIPGTRIFISKDCSFRWRSWATLSTMHPMGTC